MVKKNTGAIRLLHRLNGRWLAVHEFGVKGYSQNTLATLANILERKGMAASARVPGKLYKRWTATPEGVEAILGGDNA